MLIHSAEYILEETREKWPFSLVVIAIWVYCLLLFATIIRIDSLLGVIFKRVFSHMAKLSGGIVGEQ